MKYYAMLTFAMLWVSVALAQEIESNSIEQRIQVLESASKSLKVSGYVQPQLQFGERDAILKVGTANEDTSSFNRVGIRRGRIKLIHTQGIASYTAQLDFTEKGVAIRDLYINITDPWIKTTALRAGVFYRPFGIEVSYSSSVRESPERALIIQTLFPNERDLGGMLVLQAPKESKWSILKLEAGLFAGNSINPEIDSKRDFIGHLMANKKLNKTTDVGTGVSYYNGSVFQGTQNVFTMEGNGFVLNSDASNKGAYAKREYFGVDGFVNMKSSLGSSSLRGEYIFGQQPGTIKSSESPRSGVLPIDDPKNNTYIRNFTGGYVQLTHRPYEWPVTLVAKYEWYDPNTKVSGNSIGSNGTNATDLYQTVLGLGTVLQATKNVRLQAYYEFNTFETSSNIKDRKSNVFTLRLQYKF